MGRVRLRQKVKGGNRKKERKDGWDEMRGG